MWQIKEFSTENKMNKFIMKNKHRMQYDIVYMNNKFAIEYRWLKQIRFKEDR